jgi:hypothetical protein
MTLTHMRQLIGALGLATALVLAAGSRETTSAADQPKVVGEWSDKFDLQNVAIHTHVLPDGRVLYWSRREAADKDNLNPRNCTPRIWDPSNGSIKTTANTPGFNLFCSGHTFLADGRLFVAGGHISDGHGEPHSTIFDPKTEKWTQDKDMTGGRWYPTAVTLPDGGVLVSFGTREDGSNNITQQVWKDGTWRPSAEYDPPPYYPRMHVVPDGRVFMAGPLALTQFLNTGVSGGWTFLRPDPDINKAVALSSRINNFRDYAPSVLYDDGKILYVGGGVPPTNAAEVLDLNRSPPQWKSTKPMKFKRRQHNATLLPDGTVLVTGGTQGDAGDSKEKGFNDLRPGQPIHAAELWDPKSGEWKVMAEEKVDRCYHSTAVLLPDATVLSAGGGEYSPQNDNVPNPPKNTHKDAQIFSPPYLFKGARPDITAAPAEVGYGEKFEVKTSHPGDVGAVNWVRLSSVTHAFNSNQRINFLKFTVAATSLSVTTPPTRNLCPPGHYMLFVLNKAGVPSTARIIRIR